MQHIAVITLFPTEPEVPTDSSASTDGSLLPGHLVIKGFTCRMVLVTFEKKAREK
jgi:hypothetical protein